MYLELTAAFNLWIEDLCYDDDLCEFCDFRKFLGFFVYKSVINYF